MIPFRESLRGLFDIRIDPRNDRRNRLIAWQCAC